MNVGTLATERAGLGVRQPPRPRPRRPDQDAAPATGAAPSDDALLRRTGLGDRQAFDQLYRRYAPRVRGFARSIVRAAEDADEVVVDTMAAVWRTAHHYRAGAQVSTWILGIARNKAVDVVRAQGRAPATHALDTAAQVADPAPGPVDATAQQARRTAVAAALARLNAEHREVLYLAFYEDLPYREISRRLGIPSNTVKSRVYYAKQQLARYISSEFSYARDLL
jgi:RNA polymerase sigma-70 factor (ECF subfamily)